MYVYGLMGSGSDKSSDKRKRALLKTYLKLRRKFKGKNSVSAQQMITLPGKGISTPSPPPSPQPGTGGDSPHTPLNLILPITKQSPLSSDEHTRKRKEREEDKHMTGNPSKKQVSYDIFQMHVNDQVAAAGGSPRIPPNRTPESTLTDGMPSSSIDSKSGGRVVQHYGNNATAKGAGELLTFEGGTGVNVSVDLCDGEYVLKIKRRKTTSSSTDHEDIVERPDLMAQNAGMLLLQAELIREMGEQLLAQYRASLRSIFIE